MVFPLAIDRKSRVIRTIMDPDTTSLPVSSFEAPPEWVVMDTATVPACTKCSTSEEPAASQTEESSNWTRLWVGANPKYSTGDGPSARWLSRCEEHVTHFTKTLKAKQLDTQLHEASVEALKSISGYKVTHSLPSRDSSVDITLLLPRLVPTNQGSVTDFLLEGQIYKLKAAVVAANSTVSTEGASDTTQGDKSLEHLALLRKMRTLLEAGVPVGLSFPITERNGRFLVDHELYPDPMVVAYQVGTQSTGSEPSRA